MQEKMRHVHILWGVPEGNIGVIAAQRSLCKLLKNTGKFKVSISTPNKKVFKLHHPEFRDDEIYEPLQVLIGDNVKHNYIRWALLEFLNRILLTYMALLIKVGIIPSSKIRVINRMKQCDVILDLNLEQIKGIPITISPALLKEKPIVLVVHKLFWSLRIIYYLWTILIVKGLFKKKLVIGPASFGPFERLPTLIRLVTKYVLNRFVDMILVRDQCSAKYLNKLGIKNYVVVTDIALLTDNIKHERESLDKNYLASEFIVGVSPVFLKYTLKEEEFKNYVIAHAKCLDELVDKYNATILFLPSSDQDIIACKAIIDYMLHKAKTKVVVTYDLDVFENWIKKLKVLLTTRMHPSIIAVKNLVPVCSFIYDHKQIGFLLQVGLLKYSLLLNKVTFHTLKHSLNTVIRDGVVIKEILKSRLPKVRYEAVRKIDLILTILTK